MPGRILMAGGPGLDDEELEEFTLRVQGEEEGTGLSESEEEDGPGPPLSVIFFPLSFLVLKGRVGAFSLSFVWRDLGRRRTGMPHFDCASWSGVGKG